MKAFMSKHEMALFFILTFLFSWFPWYAGIAPEVMAMGPSLAAFLIVAIVGGKSGMGQLLRPFGRWRAGAWLWLIALLGPAVLYLGGLGMRG